MAVEADDTVVLEDEYDPPTCCHATSLRLIHINADGTLDTNFGTNGIEITTPGDELTTPFLYQAYSLLPQPDGKIIAVGVGDLGPPWHNGGIGLERFMPDGSPDPSFGIDGVAVISYGSRYETAPRDATLTPDGKIVVVGSGWPQNGGTAPVAWLRMRYLPDGSTPITINETGTSSGTVSSSPMGIACNGTYNCTAQFADQSTVTLTAAPAAGTQVSWNGACAGHALTCQVTANGTTSQVHVTFTSPSCVVPQLIGTTLASAKTAIAHTHCAVGAISKTFSTTVPAGTIITTTPTAGTSKATGWPVKLSVSKGMAPPPCVVPQVHGMTLAAAKTAIRQSHCAVGTVTKAFSSSVTAGKVISTKPQAGVTKPTGTPVTLLVSKGPHT
jgi:uncharacterized delta-60 repeat protein